MLIDVFNRPSVSQIFNFIHVEKTGGQALVSVFEDALGTEKLLHVDPLLNVEHPHHFEALDYALQRNAREIMMLHGHHWYGSHRIFFTDKLHLYFSIIRNPVDVIVSLYNYAYAKVDHPWHIIAQRYDFDAFLDNIESETVYMRGYACQCFSRSNSFEAARDSVDTFWLVLPYEHNLRLANIVLGALGLPTISDVPIRNTARHIVKANELPISTIKRIELGAKEDIRLYDYIVKKSICYV